MDKNVFEKDRWLSEVIALNSFKLVGSSFDLDKNKLSNLEFAYAKIPIDKLKELNYLISIGFELVETIINMECNKIFIDKPNNIKCRLANPKDEKFVSEIASRSFNYSRFHKDERISEKKANHLKSEWVRSFFNGSRGEWMVVAEISNEICGFLQLLKSKKKVVVIDLIAVKDKFRNKGIGKSMISYAFNDCFNNQKTLIAGTQLTNFRSISFYNKLGFKIKNAKHTLHYHKSD